MFIVNCIELQMLFESAAFLYMLHFIRFKKFNSYDQFEF